MAANQLKVVSPPALVIETGIPLESRSPLMDALRALAKAEIGASLFLPSSACQSSGVVVVGARRLGGAGWISIRKTEGGHRAWKIAEPKAR